MLNLDVQPGSGLGFFRLGMPISEAIGLIEEHNTDISRVEIQYHQSEPLERDITLNLVGEGILLSFDPFSQRLRLIEVHNLARVLLSYEHTVFSGGGMEPTFAQVYNTFGPSYPGDYDHENNRYVLQYPGLSFTFSIPAEFRHLYTKDTNELPMEMPNGVSPLASCIYLYAGGRLRNPTLPPLGEGSLYYQPVLARLGQGVLFASSSTRAAVSSTAVAGGISSSDSSGSSGSGSSSSAVGGGGGGGGGDSSTVKPSGRWGQGDGRITFSSSVQDVVAELGAPERIFHKRRDSMRIHTGSAVASSGVGSSAAASSSGGALAFKTDDYFFNYFSRGADVMFDGGTQRVKKIILHTNFPCHVSFNRYHKCNFRILLPETAPKVDPKSGRPLPAFIGPDTHWDVVKQLLGEPVGRPVVHSPGAQANPFGPTWFFGYDHIVFEVMKSNGHLASVCLFAE
eukprot:CAMPEP_0177687798 /NCGR_PEP_ID=MMETSP0447-20121125/34328_1 /TAXON_ID=0 /ORGANISM="Stygamoeba regulata, Strain BSH-02190019" /LENGTH=453 /DNA_ID=CAMNT_0019198079 /DNA_START=23 /DNA_END=1384 /DNA_ORIENTATION=+